jgi:hypothetical protein
MDKEPITIDECIKLIGNKFALQEIDLNNWYAQRFGNNPSVSAYGKTPLEACLNLLKELNK